MQFPVMTGSNLNRKKLNARILIIDDEPTLLRAESRLFSNAGYETIEAATGKEGLQLAREKRPDLVLLNVMLPDMDGSEVCRHIKSNTETAHISVVLLSSKRLDPDSQAKGLEGGADGYIQRRGPDRELLAQVGTMVRLKQTEDALRECSHQLGQRVKELNCLYGISELVETPGISLEEVLQETVYLIRAAWQYPEITCARIILQDQEFKTDNFESTAWQQVCPVKIKGSPLGQIEVCYLAERPVADEGPFLKEERKLLNSIAERLGRTVERLEAKAAVREREERFRSIVEQSQDGITLTDEAGLVITWNQAMTRFTGLEAEEALGQAIWDILFQVGLEEQKTQAWYKQLKGMILKALSSGQAPWLGQLSEREYVHPDGTRRWLQWVTFPVQTDKGYMLSSVSRDVTERVQAEEALRQSEQELSIRNQINGIFLTHPDEDMYAQVLQLILTIMNSEYGTFGYFDEYGSFVAPALTRQIYWEKCNVPEKEIIFQRGTFGGIWGRAMEERRTIIVNEGPFHMPQGHIPIENTMVTPIIYQDKLISAIHLANKPDGYDEQDRAMVEMIAAQIAPVLYARVQRDRRNKERKQAEEALRRERNLLSRITETSPVGIIVFDARGHITYANPLVQRLSGLSEDELLNQTYNSPMWQGTDQDGNPLPDEELPFAQVMRTGKAVHDVRFAVDFPDGRRISLSSNAAPLFTEWGRLDGAVLTIEDITDRIRAEEQAEQAAATAERERLARDLHDAVTQTLFSVAAIAEALPRVWKRSPDEAERGLEELRWLTQGALAEMRTMLLELRPAALTEHKLGVLLRQLGEAMMGRTQMPVTVIVEDDYPLPSEVQIAFYRIAQEALNNTAKHSRASHARVILHCEPGRGELHIYDDGCGFDPHAVQPHQLGIEIMRERAQAIGAMLTIESQPQKGTEITVDWLEPQGGQEDG